MLPPKLVYGFIPFALWFCGCMQTTLQSSPPPAAVYSLAAGNPDPISISVSAAHAQDSVGHQFMLLVLPFGTISLADPAEDLFNSLAQSLTLSGFRPIRKLAGDRPASSQPLLHARLVSASVSAFDLLVTRRVKAEVEVCAELSKPLAQPSRQACYRGSSTTWKRFGFQPELQSVFDKALLESVHGLLVALSLEPRE